MIPYTVITPPPDRPVSLAEAKSHLRVLHATEDAVIGGYLDAAIGYLDGDVHSRGGILGRALMIRTLEAYLPAFPAAGIIELPLPPLVAVASVKYLDTAGAEQTLATDVYEVETAAEPGTVSLAAGKSWPSTAVSARAVRIRYTAGYANAAAVPWTLRQAILLLTGHYYAAREATGERSAPVAFAVDALIAPHRMLGWI